MSRIKIAVLLSLALVSGCAFSASVSKGQSLEHYSYLESVQGYDDFRTVFDSTVRIRAFKGGRLAWMGSGNAYKAENNRLSILSNWHVLNDAHEVTGEFFVNGKSLGQFVLDVDKVVKGENVDIGFASCAIGETLKEVKTIGFTSSPVEVGEEIFWVGSDAGEWPNGQLGSVVYSDSNLFYVNPKAIGGDSGSSIVQFDSSGTPHIVGLIAWVGGYDGKDVGMAMHSSVVLDVMKGGVLPDLIPEEEKLTQGLLDRLREMREERQREFKVLRNLIENLQRRNEILAFQVQEYNLQVEEETQLFRDRWRKGQKDNEDRYDQIEEDNSSLSDRIMGQFSTLHALIRLAKWSFYALVAALVASIFFGQGWLTRIIVTIFRVVYQVIRTAFAIIGDALSRPIKKTDNPTESIENLREEIGTIDDPAN